MSAQNSNRASGQSADDYYYSESGSTRTPTYSRYSSQESQPSTYYTNAPATTSNPTTTAGTGTAGGNHHHHNTGVHQRKSTQPIALEDSLTWCVDGRGIISTLYSLLQNAKQEVYISVSMIDWGLILDEERGITLLDMLAHLCNNEVSLFLLLGERLFQQITIPYELVHPNCIVKFVSQYGPSIKDASIVWVPSIDELIASHRDLPISQFSNKSINQLGDTGVFEYNLCYVMVDKKLLLLGPLEFDSTLYGSIGHCVSVDNSVGGSSSANSNSSIQNDLSADRHGSKKSSHRDAKQQPASYFEQFCSSLWNSITCNLPETASAFIQANATTNSRKASANQKQPMKAGAASMPLVSTMPDLYHRIGAVVRCTPSMNEFVQKNWNQNGAAAPLRSLTPEMQLVGAFRNGESTEAPLLKEMFRNAGELIYIETPHLHSTDLTANRIIESVLKRLISAHEHCLRHNGDFSQDPCRAIILTNASYSGTNILDRVSSMHTDHTVLAIAEFLTKRGYLPIEFKNRIFVGFLHSSPHYIYIKSTIILQDSQCALLTSSSLVDRCFTGENSELGLFVEAPERVKSLRQYLFRDHLSCASSNDDNGSSNHNSSHNSSTAEITVDEFFDACYQQQGHLRRFKIPKDDFSKYAQSGLQLFESLLGKVVKR